VNFAGNVVMTRQTLSEQRLKVAFISRIESIHRLLEAQIRFGAFDGLTDAIGNSREIPHAQGF